jgi:protein-arginine deiminase
MSLEMMTALTRGRPTFQGMTTLRCTPLLCALGGLLVAALAPVAPAVSAPISTVPDLRADVNRDGAVDVAGVADEAGEDQWQPGRGAIFLPNIDDDSRRCRVPFTERQLFVSRPDFRVDRQLASCNDSTDAAVNGESDAADLARLRLMPLTAAPGVGARLIVEGTAGRFVRIFVNRDGWQPLGRDGRLRVEDLANGTELGIEGRDIVRDPRLWDGRVIIHLRLDGDPRGPLEDVVAMKVAPVLIQNDLQKAEHLFVGGSRPGPKPADLRSQVSGFAAGRPTPIPAGVLNRVVAGVAAQQRSRDADADRFTRSLARVVEARRPEVPLTRLPGDTWAQDVFEAGWVSMPSPDGRSRTMRVVVRSANLDSGGGLRAGARASFTRLRGPDVGVVQQFTRTRGRAVDDSLNSTGNLEALPPYSSSTGQFPRGRILMGASRSRRPDPSFVRMLRAQGLQSPLFVDTSWLTVGHIDETVHVVPAPTPRGWTLMVADPRRAVTLLREARASGAGSARLFVGKTKFPAPKSDDLLGLIRAYAAGPVAPATRTVRAILSDQRLMTRNAQAAVFIDRQLRTLLAATDLQANELVRVPVLFDAGQSAIGGAGRGAAGRLTWTAYSPGIANSLSLGDGTVVAPDPHGPSIGGRDLFRQDSEQALGRVGVRVDWVDDWEWLHRGEGEVHCSTNAFRDISASVRWWETLGR